MAMLCRHAASRKREVLEDSNRTPLGRQAYIVGSLLCSWRLYGTLNF